MTSYSPSTKGFYSSDVHDLIPADAVEVAEADYQALLLAQSQGLQIIPGPDGAPIAVSAASLFSLAASRAYHLVQLAAACARAIMTGYSSSALGSAALYPSTGTDQQNLTDAMNASLAPGRASDWSTLLWHATPDGSIWTFSPHTAAQVQQVHSDWITYRLAQQQKLYALNASIKAAVTTDAIAAVVWS